MIFQIACVDVRVSTGLHELARQELKNFNWATSNNFQLGVTRPPVFGGQLVVFYACAY